jgi:hypothetical protein
MGPVFAIIIQMFPEGALAPDLPKRGCSRALYAAQVNNVSLDRSESGFIRPLALAENQFLQVLLPRFSMKRSRGGIVLNLEFDDGTATIWTRQAKYEIIKKIGSSFERKRREYQARLDAFLLEGRGETFEYDDQAFPFRYASGGTLPILRIGNEEYFALFYRDIFPIGWNIANGACDSRDELLDPSITIERELREELVIANTKGRRRYVFEGDNDKPLDRPEFAVARKIWQEHLPKFDITKFGELIIPLKWLNGPDSISLKFGAGRRVTSSGYFLNINADDFGIELDKVAKLNLDPGDILCDGEITQGMLVNAPIGLFGIDSISMEMLDAAEREFIPDKFFFNGRLYGKNHFKRVVEREFIPSISRIHTAAEMSHWNAAGNRYGLCPVTKRIMKRYLSRQVAKPPSEKKPYDVFISFAGEDRRLASTVYEFLTRKKQRVFFSEQNIASYYGRAIDEALLSAKSLVAIGTKHWHLCEPWPEYEYRSFHNYILFKKKPEGTQLLSFITGFAPIELPPPLCHYEAIVANPRNLTPALERLAAYVRG